MDIISGVRITIGQAVEHESAWPIRASKRVPIGQAVEHDIAMPVTAVFGSSTVLAVVAVREPDYHVPADHHDPVAFGTEIAVVIAAVFVAGKLVAARVLRADEDTLRAAI